MRFNMRLDGVNGYVRAINEIGRATPKAVMRSMEANGARRILKTAIPLTPVDTGELRRSGAIYPTRQGGTTLSVTVGFGNERVRYALAQHERTDYRHPRGGQAKYLEAAVQAQAGAAQRDLATDVANAWKAAAR